MDILRFLTAGNVDDGKSTLIGRLLYDTNNLLQDQLEAIQRASRNKPFLDLSLITDGLKAEREQGITIDVAYKYFQTAKRKFIIADCPGHLQYTRNMITGATHSQVAIILVDARKGIQEQTKRHTVICTKFGVQHIILCVNKMDLVNFDENVFNQICQEYKAFLEPLPVKTAYFLPVSAFLGDNIAQKSSNMSWYQGQTLIEILENEKFPENRFTQKRFQVQYVLRPHQDYRGFAGSIISGTFRKGDKVKIFPTKILTQIASIEFAGKELSEAHAGQAVTIRLQDEVAFSRGDILIGAEENISETQNIKALIAWLDDTQILQVGKKYLLQKGSKLTKCIVKAIPRKLNIHTATYEVCEGSLHVNEIAELHLRLAEPIHFDNFYENASNGNFILIDEQTYQTCAAGIFEEYLHI
ncbi:MAG: GTP-binding protein [Raineya sp.]|nr:GTP-binding protein [Raineya sp.]MDW8295301.1 GTP-binding protein [Raineya sp.]